MSTHSPGNGSDADLLQTLYESFATTSPQNDDLGDPTPGSEPTTGYETCTFTDLSCMLYVYLIPVLVLVGIAGNAMSVYVFVTSKLRHLSTSQYLSALAISDSIFLLSLIPPWLSTLKINKLFHRNGFCQIFVYISYVTSCLSAWLVVAFTVERFVAVQYPLQRNAFCSVKRARYVIAALTAAALLVNAPVLVITGAGAGSERVGECNIVRDKLLHAAMFNMIDTTVSFSIPTALIVILNLRIAYDVCKLERARARLLRPAAGRERAGAMRSQRRVTRMLLLVSSVFVLFNMPAYTLRIIAYAYDMNSKKMDDKWLVIHHVAAVLFNANFGINFFLYCLSGQNFRCALLQALPCRARSRTAIRTHTFNRGRSPSLTTSAISNGTEPTHCGLTSMVQHPAPRLVVRWDTPRTRPGPAEAIEMTELRPRNHRDPSDAFQVTHNRPLIRGGSGEAIEMTEMRTRTHAGPADAIQIAHMQHQTRGDPIEAIETTHMEPRTRGSPAGAIETTHMRHRIRQEPIEAIVTIEIPPRTRGGPADVIETTNMRPRTRGSPTNTIETTHMRPRTREGLADAIESTHMRPRTLGGPTDQIEMTHMRPRTRGGPTDAIETTHMRHRIRQEPIEAIVTIEIPPRTREGLADDIESTHMRPRTRGGPADFIETTHMRPRTREGPANAIETTHIRPRTLGGPTDKIEMTHMRPRTRGGPTDKIEMTHMRPRTRERPAVAIDMTDMRPWSYKCPDEAIEMTEMPPRHRPVHQPPPPLPGAPDM